MGCVLVRNDFIDATTAVLEDIRLLIYVGLGDTRYMSEGNSSHCRVENIMMTI